MNKREFTILAKVIRDRVAAAKTLTDYDGGTTHDVNLAQRVLRDFTVVLADELAKEYPKTFNKVMFYNSITK